jgi:nicotinamide mononucleotide transporter
MVMPACCYYTLAAIYGYAVWKFGRKRHQQVHQPMPITHMPLRLYLPAALFFAASWVVIYWVLVAFTNSDVPVLDSFTNALSFVGLWTLARKYVRAMALLDWGRPGEHLLYVYKGIPLKAGFYALYVDLPSGILSLERMMNEGVND